MANSVDPDQTAPIGAVCSGSTLFTSILNLSVMLDNHLQQTTSADNIFRCIFSWRFKGKVCRDGKINVTNWDQPVLLIAKADKWLHNIELLSGCLKDSHVNLG